MDEAVMVEATQAGKRGFQSHFLTVAPATMYSSPQAAPHPASELC